MSKNKTKRKNNKRKVENYYNNGIIEANQTGNIISVRNILTESQNKTLQNHILNQFDDSKCSIDEKVRDLRSLIIKEDPLSLLKFCHQQFLLSNINITSEHQLSADAISSSRLTEYVQSVIVSSESQHFPINDEDPSQRFFQISNLFDSLLSDIQDFYLIWALKQKDESADWDDIIDIWVETVLFSNVRGHRYPVIETEYHQLLLQNHDMSFKKIYGISADHVVRGLAKILYALSQETFDQFHIIANAFESHLAGNSFDKNYLEDAFSKVFYDGLNDVVSVTGWPENFVRDLSYSINEVDTFFDTQSDYSGWPISELPVQRRPFICIQDKYYCFDYYTLSDNFYRAVQRAIVLHTSTEEWKDLQKDASEHAAETVFKKLLPGSEIYRDNYYPVNRSLKQMNENDLLIIYNRVMIIVEVKAGAFVHTSPMTDFEAHKTSYIALIEAPDHQCERVSQYINRSDSSEVIFYDNEKREKLRFNRNDIDDYYKISVTIDNINAIAARAEKIGFLNLQSNAISLGLDDLITYSEYFDSPLVFLHYLSQRRDATMTRGLQLFDELDHLGLYIEYNCYPMIIKPENEYDTVFFDGFRENLDTYFGMKYHPDKTSLKPEQVMPSLFKDLISCIEKSECMNRVWLSSYLLNFNNDSREAFCAHIKTVVERQKTNHRMMPIIVSGDKNSLRYCAYVSQPGIVELSDDEKRSHLLSLLLQNGESDRVRIDILVDENGVPINLSGCQYTRKDIDENEIDNLQEKGKTNASLRVDLYKQKHGKIGRNELCPCGSGKKYKKCCGR